jgi:hypothetical protein
VSAFFVVTGPKAGTIPIRCQFKSMISQQNKLESGGFFIPMPMNTAALTFLFRQKPP